MNMNPETKRLFRLHLHKLIIDNNNLPIHARRTRTRKTRHSPSLPLPPRTDLLIPITSEVHHIPIHIRRPTPIRTPISVGALAFLPLPLRARRSIRLGFRVRVDDDRSRIRGSCFLLLGRG